MATAGKVALITGASAGIGKASAVALLEAGWRVVFTGRRLELMEKAIAAAGVGPDRAIAVASDVGDPASVKALFAKTVAAFGRLDMLFNNAGQGAPAMPIEDLPFDKWKAVIDTNLTGVFLCTQEAFRLMKAQAPRGGRIINNGSISAHVPRPQAVAYTASKHGVTGLTKTIALDGRPFDIVACQIDIGNAATEMTDRMTKGVLQPDGELMVEARMDVKHVASAIVYMANLPLDANVHTMTIMAPKMPFVGRG